MKNLFLGFLTVFFVLFAFQTVQADELQDLIQQKKPCAILITADWADKAPEVSSAFANAKNTFANRYNFKVLNIASKEMKEFNKTNYIYTNLPYIVLYKEKGRMSRWINRDCILDSSCMADKLDLFAN